MLSSRSIRLLCVVLFGLINLVQAMVYDNRFMPLYARNYSRTCSCRSAAMADGFFMTGRDAFSSQHDIGIFDIFGPYDQSKVALGIQRVDGVNPFDLPTTPITIRGLKNDPLLWHMSGKLQAQGFALQYEQHIWRYLSTGFTAFFMHLFSRNEFLIAPETVTGLKLTEQQVIDLDALRRQMNGILELKPATWSVFGVSDIDWYVRIGNVWDYSLKCRRIDLGVRAGALIPSGIKRKIDNPASIPFGGNGLWGVYGAIDTEIELKQDWFFGALVRLNQRFAQTQESRIPVAEEQPLYAAAIGNVQIEPGSTVVLSPYVRFENVREGFGIQAQYTLVSHDDDGLIDKRAMRVLAAIFTQELKKTHWIAEYVSVDAFYDFTVGRHSIAPIFSAKWDIPIKFFLADGAVKTHRLSLGVIFNF